MKNNYFKNHFDDAVKKDIVLLRIAFCMFAVLCFGMLLHEKEIEAKRVDYTVTYKNRTLVLFTATGKNVVGEKASANFIYPTYAKVRKIWGKPNKDKKKGPGKRDVVYKMPGTTIELYFDNKGYGVGHEKKKLWVSKTVDVKGGNTSVCGVKKGMTKSTAISILNRKFGRRALKIKKKRIELWIGGFTPTTYTIKGNRVSKIFFWTS